MLTRHTAIAGLLAATATTASAVDIQLDLTHDAFFSNPANAVALNTLNQAAADVEGAITTVLGAATDTSFGSAGGTTVTFDFDFSYTNPTTGGGVAVSNTALGADALKIFVGHRNLGGSTLAQGGPGGFGYSASANPFSNFTDLANATGAAEAAANLNMGRGGGPVMGSLSGQFNSGGSPIPGTDFTLGFGPTLGNLWFDSDSDNNGVTDSGILNSSFWHLDYSTPVASGKFDLYSIAIHEILHAIGIGTSDSWDDHVSGDDWTGAVVIDLLGTGVDTLASSGDQAHVRSDLMSRVLSDPSQLQSAIMAPAIAPGQRKFITELDLAFLQDTGWDVVAIPEPGTMALAGVGVLTLLRRRRAA